ncbi:hypothetical protein D1007_12139 [Hordeum vulgare]|nr:hypothetical protein D1007_12139 [Hordeum vulgare]
MTTPIPSKDNFSKKVINPYLPEVMKHLEAIEMHEAVLHIGDVHGPKKEGSEKTRLVEVEQGIFKFQGMVERGFSTNHGSMIMDLTWENQLDNYNVAAVLFKIKETPYAKFSF